MESISVRIPFCEQARGLPWPVGMIDLTQMSRLKHLALEVHVEFREGLMLPPGCSLMLGVLSAHGLPNVADMVRIGSAYPLAIPGRHKEPFLLIPPRWWRDAQRWSGWGWHSIEHIAMSTTGTVFPSLPARAKWRSLAIDADAKLSIAFGDANAFVSGTRLYTCEAWLTGPGALQTVSGMRTQCLGYLALSRLSGCPAA